MIHGRERPYVQAFRQNESVGGYPRRAGAV